MIRKLWKRLVTGGGEIAISLVVVMVFFLLLLGLLSRSFPHGSGLGDLIGSSGFSGQDDGESRLSMDIRGSEKRRSTKVATLYSVRRRVKDRPTHSIAWSDSQQGTPLYDRHAVQTFSKSRATIAFDRNNKLELGENSLVVLRREEQEEESQVRRASLVMLGGELRGLMSDSPGETLQLDIVTASGTSQIRTLSSGGSSAEFNIALGDGDSTTLTMYDGAAEIVINGERIRLESNQAMRMDPSGFSVSSVNLPAAPVPSAPLDGEVYRFRSQPPSVQFKWDGSAESDGYHFVLAEDRKFKRVFQDFHLKETSLTHGNLDEGIYYWRVSEMKSNLEGKPSPSRKIEMIKDTEPPALQVAFPEGPVTSDRLLVKGVTEPGSVVYVANEQVVPTGTGEFEIALFLERGLNVVTVEVVDAAGNTTYESQVVNAKY